MSKVLVTGGCGYIGSHTAVDLIHKGFDVISIDNFHNAQKSVPGQIEQITGRPFENVNLDLKDRQAVLAFFEDHKDITSIIHFAAYKSVEESTRMPLAYHENNVMGLINLLMGATSKGIRNFIFSSSCTVYGQPDVIPVTEASPIKTAESPYGRTKQICEFILQDLAIAGEMNVVLLRYFNPAGAHESALIGEDASQKASNLVPVITETAIGKRDEMTVFGTDYHTRDGSCVRDYIHIMDLADAHTRALQFVLNKRHDPVEIFNLGYGEGVTVLEAIHAFEQVTGKKLNYKLGPRRAGDIVKIFSDSAKAADLLGWKASRSIEDIMRTAWKWEEERSK